MALCPGAKITGGKVMSRKTVAAAAQNVRYANRARGSTGLETPGRSATWNVLIERRRCAQRCVTCFWKQMQDEAHADQQ